MINTTAIVLEDPASHDTKVQQTSACFKFLGMVFIEPGAMIILLLLNVEKCWMQHSLPMKLNTLKTFAVDCFSRVILYDPPLKFALKTALWLLKPDTPRLDPFQGFSIWYF